MQQEQDRKIHMENLLKIPSTLLHTKSETRRLLALSAKLSLLYASERKDPLVDISKEKWKFSVIFLKDEEELN